MLGLIALSTISFIVIAAVFTALLWAAVADGREDDRIRGRRPKPRPVPVRGTRRPLAARHVLVPTA